MLVDQGDWRVCCRVFCLAMFPRLCYCSILIGPSCVRYCSVLIGPSHDVYLVHIARCAQEPNLTVLPPAHARQLTPIEWSANQYGCKIAKNIIYFFMCSLHAMQRTRSHRSP